MYFTPEQIARSIHALASVHPFHGITFLACKQAGLPVGEAIVFPLDAKTDKFLKEHHRIDPGTDWFFQPFKSSDLTKKWVRPDYSAKGLQAINTQTFASAFLHERNTRIWGWHPKYVEVLADRLPKYRKVAKKIPAFDLAVWLFRSEAWSDATDVSEVVNRFLTEFSITSEEKVALFDIDVSSDLPLKEVFHSERSEWQDLRNLLPAPPDARPDQGGTLAYLETRGVGPANSFVLEPADRLSLITGDNGLGKSFLLETAWWALTGTWADLPAYPSPTQKYSKVEISFAIEGEQAQAQRRSIQFDWRSISWPQPRSPTVSGLVVYARVDGSFAVWDPARQTISTTEGSRSSKVSFSNADVWNGLSGRIEGLVRDWIRWQNSSSTGPQFEIFRKVLSKLSPPDLGVMTPGMPVRIPNDPRDIPTLVHPYGETPIVYASAGVRRVVTLAYLIVWAWHEHTVAASMGQIVPQRRMVVLVDELEAHLHPRWQRALLPALMEVSAVLSPALQAQFLVATHSPLVMASSEAIFDTNIDKLFHLDMATSGEVSLQEVDFVRFGDVSAWLTSPVFELRHARSTEGEAAIEAAKALQLRDSIKRSEVDKVTDRLRQYLAQNDRFWPRWIAFAERYGVKV